MGWARASLVLVLLACAYADNDVTKQGKKKVTSPKEPAGLDTKDEKDDDLVSNVEQPVPTDNLAAERERAMADIRRIQQRQYQLSAQYLPREDGSSLPPQQQPALCSPSLFKVTSEVSPVPLKFRWESLTATDIVSHLVMTLPVTQFGRIPETPFSNVEGRISHPVISAMGGDAGEFILSLNAFEAIFKIKLTDFQIASLFSDFLLAVNKSKFLLQTDQMALVNLCRTTKFCQPKDSLDNPSLEMIPVLRDELLKPEHIGCSHLKHLLDPKYDFQTDERLVFGFLHAFYNLLWGVPVNSVAEPTLTHLRSRLMIQVLQGGHVEGALLRVFTSKCSPDFIPMIIPEFKKTSISLLFEDAAKDLREITARFLGEKAQMMNLSKNEATNSLVFKLVSKMNEIADHQYNQAVILDDGKTPVFSLKYPGPCCMGQ